MSKATLVHQSHTIENIVLKHRLPAMMFTGFQESSYWRQETKRYEAISQVAKQVCIFAGKPLPADSNLNVTTIPLAEDDLLRQEWFLLVLSDDFSVVLCGLDNLDDVTDEGHRTFETICTFDTRALDIIVSILEEVVERYAPNKLTILQNARQTYTPRSTSLRLLSEFMNELIYFEDYLNFELRATAKALLEQKQMYQAILANAPIVLLALSNDLDIIFFEGILTERFEMEFSTLIGESFAVLQDKYPKLSVIAESVQEEKEFLGEITLKPDLDLEIHGSPLLDHNEVVQGFLCIMIDITERRRNERIRLESEHLRVVLEHERDMNEKRAHLMTTISHQFRTPLSVIQSSSELLSNYYDKMTEEKRKARLANIQTQVNNLTQMLDDIGVVMQSTTLEQTFKPEPSDLVALCQRAIDAISQKLNASQTITLFPDPNLTPFWLDPRLFEHALTRILSNAIKYSPQDSKIKLQVSVEENESVVFQIQDQGIGIVPQDIEQLTLPFFRGKNVENVHGVGLGLTVAEAFIKVHRGTIKIDSTLEKGTTFTVTLPRLFTFGKE